VNTVLIKKLVSMGIIRQNTEIEAYYHGNDLSGRPVLRTRGNFFVQTASVLKSTGDIVFKAVSTVDGSAKTVLAENLVTIDGMTLEALAETYCIDANGKKIAQGKRRGRRPRSMIEAG
jgi:hypothetical protein